MNPKNNDPTQQQEQQQQEQPDFITSAQLNAALTNHFKRLPNLIADALAAQATKQEPAKETKGEKGETEFQILKREFEELKAKSTKAEADLRAERTEKRAREVLTKAGMPEANHRFALAFLREGLLEYGDDGEPIVKLKSQRAGLTEEAIYGLEAGLAQWLKGEDAKTPLPAPKATGPVVRAAGAAACAAGSHTPPPSGRQPLTERQRYELIGNEVAEAMRAADAE